MNIKKSIRSLMSVAIFICMIAFLFSCGGGGDDASSGSSSGQSGSITLAVDKTTLPADGSSSATITATIKDSAGNPVRHYTEVVFTTNLGRFRDGGSSYTMKTQPPLKEGFPNPDAAPTGIAVVQFIASTTPGSAKVTVSSNSVTNSVYVTLKGGTGAIALEVTPGEEEPIPADGSSAYQIKATVTDDLGGAVIVGTEVTFETGLGRYQNGAKTYTVKTTDDTGIVYASLIAGVVPGTTYVQANSGNVFQAKAVVLAKTDPAYSEITVEANPSRIAANGESQSLITATVSRIQNIANAGANATGQPISGVPITIYKITSNAEPEPLPEANTYKGVGTSIAGPFYSFGGLTTFQMTAIPDSKPYFTVWIFNPLTNERDQLISTSTFPYTTHVDKEGNTWITYETLVKNESLPLVPGNYQLEIQTNCRYEIKILGDIGPAQTGKTVLEFAKTDTNGKAYYTYTSDWLQGFFTIRAETGELSNSENALREEAEIEQTVESPDAIEIKAAAKFVIANGLAETTVTAQVWIDGNQAPDGTNVNFSATGGPSITPTAKTVQGVASATLKSIASSKSFDSEVSAIVGNNSTTIKVFFLGVTLSDMQATPPAIFANGEDISTITVRLEDEDGQAISGETIGFLAPEGGGTLTPYVDSTGNLIDPITDAKGVARINLIAPITAGTATVTAYYGDGTITTNTTISFEASGVDGSIVLEAKPTTIPADGVSSTVITATIKYSSGTAAVPKGTSVTFTTNLGTFANGTQSYTTITPDDTGVVNASLKAGKTVGSAQVTVSAINISQTVYVGIGGDAVSIKLTANPTGIPADGKSSSVITATLTDGSGAPVTPGTSVTFKTDLGTFVGGGTSIEASTTGDTGSVSVSLISATTAGTATVTATVSGVTQSVNVNFSGSVVGSITVTANPDELAADGTSESLIRADVKDAQGNPVPDGESISFVVLTGTGKLSDTSADTEGGFAEVTYTASKTSGTETVRAMSSNNVSGTVNISLTGTAAGSITVTASPTSIPADGASTSTITALVKTADNQVVEGASVTFITSRGVITSPHTTDANGQATATLTSERYVDTSVQITASCQGKTAYTFVAFTGVTLTLTAVPESLLTGDKDGSRITATLLDAAANPMPNTAVTFTTDRGTLTPPDPQLTDAAGQAFVTLNSNDAGLATVKGKALGAEGTVEVNFTRYSFNLTAIPTTIRVGGETSLITAELLDQGVPKAGETVFFSSTLGVLNPYQQDTGADGKATSTLISREQSGTAIIDANTTVTVGAEKTELSASAKVVITGGTAYKIVLTADPDIISINTGIATIKAAVYDANEQPAADQAIYFRINKSPGGGEYLSASVQVTNSFGQATVSFVAGSLSSTLKGVEIEANTAEDFGGSFGLATLTIAGPVAKIGIGMDLETVKLVGGSLEVAVAGMATDVNGNPVADGTKLYFSVTAIEFDEDRANDHTINCWDDKKNPLTPCPAKGTPGFGFTWFSDDVNQDGTMYSIGGPMCTTEDVNHNGILDPGEDKNDNGVIDPIQGCTISDFADTTNGVGQTTLIYPPPQAANIRVRITAEAGGVSNFYDAILLCTEAMVELFTCGIAY